MGSVDTTVDTYGHLGHINMLESKDNARTDGWRAVH